MNRLYAFLYDDFLSAPAYQRIIANIETRCSVLGIQGRVSRLAMFRDPKELVENLIRDGAQTIVVVGNDHTLEKVMWFLPGMSVTVGYIPVCEPWGIAQLLGIPMGEAACDIVAARRIESLDIGQVNDRHFLTEVIVEDTGSLVDVDGQFKIGPSQKGTLHIRNLGSVLPEGLALADAKDGWLELAVRPEFSVEKKGWFSFLRRGADAREPSIEETRVLMKQGTIESTEPIRLSVDGQFVAGRRLELSVLPGVLKMIMGRSRRLGLQGASVLSNSEASGIVSATSDQGSVETDSSSFLSRIRSVISNMRRWRNWYTR